MPKPISPSQLKKLTLNIRDPALRKHLSQLGSPPLDTLIRDAGVILEERLRTVSGLVGTSLYGVDLVDGALEIGKPLKFSEHHGEQDGVRLLYRGAIQFIRNPPMHRLIDYSLESAEVSIAIIDSLLRLLSSTKPATPVKTGKRVTRKGSETIFFNEVKTMLPESQGNILRSLHEQAKKGPYKVTWGSGTKHCSFNLKYEPVCRRAFATFWSNGTLSLNFGALKDNSKQIAWRERLREATAVKLGLEIPSEYPHVWATYPISEWGSKAEKLKEMLEGLLKEA